MKLEIPDEWFDEEELKNTPGRWDRWVKEWTGVQEKFDDGNGFTVFDNTNYDQMVVEANIPFHSICAHHIAPFFGVAHVGYVPGEKVCGISKLARVVDKFASRPQLQERMTQNVVDFLQDQLSPKGAMAVVIGTHLCMAQRGVRKQGVKTVTSALKGEYVRPEVRDEFFRLVELGA